MFKGFEVYQTGGGCTAWRRDVNDTGAHVLITGLDGCSHELSGEGDRWLVGLHWEDSNGDSAWSDSVDAHTETEAIEAANMLTLAFTFAETLESDIGAEKLDTVVGRNRSAKYVAHGSCASHDFCDANMTMLAAWEAAFGGEPGFINGNDDGSLERVNAAWTFARAHDFFTHSAR